MSIILILLQTEAPLSFIDLSTALTSSSSSSTQTTAAAPIPDFHSQERERMFNPSACYTYRLKDFSILVGPIRGVSSSPNLLTTPSKGKCHPLLVVDRPPYVTIIVIVRDAVARLKNGEGTRQHICELVKESQFISQVYRLPISILKLPIFLK